MTDRKSSEYRSRIESFVQRLLRAVLLVELFTWLGGKFSSRPHRKAGSAEEEARGEKPFHAHENVDVNVPGIALGALGLAVVIALVMLAPWPLFHLFDRTSGVVRETSPSIAGEDNTPPEPRLQSRPSADLQSMLEQKKSRLSSYGWVDRSHGVVHIPIGVAMDRIAGTDGNPWGVEPMHFGSAPSRVTGSGRAPHELATPSRADVQYQEPVEEPVPNAHQITGEPATTTNPGGGRP